MKTKEINNETYDAMVKFMKTNAKPDGAIGYELRDGKEAVEWYRYYKTKHPEKLPYMVSRLREEKPYMVPCQWPWWYDLTWTPSESKRGTLFPTKPAEDTEKRQALVDSLLKRFRGAASGQEVYSQGARPTEPVAPPAGSPEFDEMIREKARALAASLRETEESGRLKDILAKIDRRIPVRTYKTK